MQPSAQARFGTFGGVFTPCVLTILGVIMFMRTGYVVGAAGFVSALLILVIAKLITGLTTLSLSAIATNTEVRTGGVYYMISRTLGSDFGGAIGITLFVSQAVSIAFYVIGFSDAFFDVLLTSETAKEFVSDYYIKQLVSTLVITGLFALTFKGADLAIKAQYFILAVLLLSVAAFVLGGLGNFSGERFSENFSGGGSEIPFWYVFAIFFPAATGITAGANLSGDLKNPGRSIPYGTLAAIGFTAIIYFIQIALLAGFETSDNLIAQPFVAMKEMSLFGPLIALGVFAATLSSALGSFLGAPRILQAMGKDKLMGPLEYFGEGHGPADEPRRATVLSLAIAIVVVWAGSLNAVAQVISMFFLIAYGMINLSAFVEGRGGNPSFRPTFRWFGWPLALAGAIGCGIAMLKIDQTYALIAMIIAALIYLWLRGRDPGNWEDAKRGFVFSRARQNLLMLEGMTQDPKNWRPVLAVVTDDAERDESCIRAASWVESSRGLLSVLEIQDSDHSIIERLKQRTDRMGELKAILHQDGVTALADSVVTPGGLQHLDTILQGYSIGDLRPNTIMMSIPPPNQIERRKDFCNNVATLADFDLNLVLYKGGATPVSTRPHKQIDVWWHGHKNGSLLALFAYLTNIHPHWKNSYIRMLRMVRRQDEYREAKESLRKMMEAARLEVHVEVIVSEAPISDVIADASEHADLMLLGLSSHSLDDFGKFLDQQDAMLKRLPPSLLVWSNGGADLFA